MKDLIGRKFGRLTVISKTKKRKWGSKVWLCRCTCGKLKELSTFRLTTGNTKSCGCFRRDKFLKMRKKLTGKNHPTYKHGKSNTKKYKKFAKRKSHIKTKFGITFQEYENLKRRQRNCCAICGEKEITPKWGHPSNLSIDHNHRTREVRGLLCMHCNTAIGHFKESKKLLLKAIQYLSKQ